jgi:hypothetical protein
MGRGHAFAPISAVRCHRLIFRMAFSDPALRLILLCDAHTTRILGGRGSVRATFPARSGPRHPDTFKKLAALRIFASRHSRLQFE